MRFEIFSQGGCQEHVLHDVIRANDYDSRMWQGVVNTQEMWPDSHKIIVATGDPTGAVLRAYTQEGHTKELSPAMFGARLKLYCEQAQYNWSSIRLAFPDTRVLKREDHTKPRHWAQSMGFAHSLELDGAVTHAIPNAQELRTLCERDCADELKAYTDELAAL